MEDFGTECESNWFQYSCSLNPGCKYGVILSWNYCTSVHSSLHSHFVHTFSLGHHKQRLFVCLHSRTTYGFNGLVYEVTLILNSKQRIELVTWKSLCEFFFFFFTAKYFNNSWRWCTIQTFVFFLSLCKCCVEWIVVWMRHSLAREHMALFPPPNYRVTTLSSKASFTGRPK